MYTAPMDTVSPLRHRRAEKTQKKTMIWREIRNSLPGAVSFLFLSLGNCFTLPSPFALMMLVAYLHQSGSCPKGACIGMLAGLLLRLIWGIEADWAQTAVFLMLAFWGKYRIKGRKQAYFVLLIALCVRALPGMIGHDGPEILRQMGTVALGVCLMPGSERSVEILLQKNVQKTQDDMLCLAFPWMMLLCGSAPIELFTLNVGVAGACISVLLSAWTTGAASAAAVGIGAGFALFAGGAHVMYFLMLPFSGFLSGCFHQKSRIGTAAAFFFSSVMLIFVAMQDLPSAFIWNLLPGICAFLCVPKKKARGWMQKVIRLQWMKPRENAFIRMRMQQWVQAVQRLSKELPETEIPLESREAEMEAVVEHVCSDCDRLPICWRDEYEKNKNGLQAVLEEENVDFQVINRYFSHCSRIKEIPEELERIMEKRNQIQLKRQLATYQRYMLETHLSALSQAAQMISLEGLNIEEEEEEWQSVAEEALEKMHFAGRLAFVKRIDGHLIAGVQSDMMPIQPPVSEKIAQQLGLYLGKNLLVMQQNASRVIVEEAPPFDVMMGQATAGAYGEDEHGYLGILEENGDALLLRALSGGRMMFALSDGMGHGRAAKTESRRTLEMLADCLESGYTREQAMRVVNGAMLNATGGEIFATVDMGILDLWTGETEMSKLGACSSYLVQGQKIVKLSGEALPLGILQEVLPSEKRVQLAEGDRVILMSDGIADVYETEEEVMRMLYRRLSERAQDMADAVLQDALERQNGLPEDDMTVMCIQLITRYQRKKRSLSA